MKNKRLIPILLIVMISVFGIVSAIDVGDCINITSSGTYLLNSSVNSVGDLNCINIASNDTVFDCDNFEIKGTNVSLSNGIYSTLTNNITVKNCRISDFNNGINYHFVDNSLVHKVIVSDSYSVGVRFAFGENLTINDSFINTSKYNLFVYTNVNVTIINNTLYSGEYGLWSTQNDDMLIYDNVLFNNSLYGWYMEDDAVLSPNKIYNNLFNNTRNLWLPSLHSYVYWNTSNQTGTRIFGDGSLIGGNYWTNLTGVGYSETCLDSNTDGFCDNPFNMSTMLECFIGVNCTLNNTDFLPLSDEGIGLNSSACNVLFNESSPHLNTTAFTVFTDCSSGFQLFRNGSVVGNNSLQYPLNSGYYNFTVTRNITAGYLNVFDDEWFNLTSYVAPPSSSECSAFERASYQIILIAGALIVLAGVIFYLYSKGGLQEMTVGQIMLTFIVIIVGVALYIAVANSIASTCSL